MGAKISGLDEAKAKLSDLKARAESLRGQREVPLADLLTTDFLRKHTAFSSFDDLLRASGFKVDGPEDFTAIPDAAWDAYIATATSFPNWKAMLEAATKEWVAKKLKLG
jgi:hypothetical protein